MTTEIKLIAGVGIEVSEDLFNLMIKQGWFTGDRFYDDKEHCLEIASKKMRCRYGVGNHEAGDNNRYYLFIDSDSLFGCVEKSADFLGHLNDIGMGANSGDLKILRDGLIF